MHVRKILFKTLGAFMALAMLLAFLPVLNVTAATFNVAVGDNIQAAIDTANPGDTIQLAAGTHDVGAQLIINKPLTLRGISKADTLVKFDASVLIAIRVTADDVTIEDIHLQSQASGIAGDTHVIDIPFKAWGPDPAFPEEFFQNFTLHNAIIEGARRSLWIHMEDLTIENTDFIYSGNRQAIQIRQVLGTTKINNNTFTGGAVSGAAIIFEGWHSSGDIEISGNDVTRHSQFLLLNMGNMPEQTDLKITANTIDHQDRSGSTIIFVAPQDFTKYDSILIQNNTITNPNPERLAVYVDYTYGGPSAAAAGQIKVYTNTLNFAFPWGKPTDEVHGVAPVGFSSSAPVGMALTAFDLQNNNVLLPPVHNVTQDTYYATIQDAIDAADPGDTINVSPGTYDETASGRTLFNGAGPYQFGLFIGVGKDNITLQGVDASGTPITDYNDVAASITTNATNNFGHSGVFVEADNITITGLEFLENKPGDNKTIEVIGDNIIFRNNIFGLTYGGSFYINDWRYNEGTSTSYVESYTVEDNWFRYGGSIDISSGPGVTGDVANRIIRNNLFTADGEDISWANISFNGNVPDVGWFNFPVGGATINGNTFVGLNIPIRSRGAVIEGDFNWLSYWQDNNFDKAVVAWDTSAGMPRSYDYTTSGGTQFLNTRRIGTVIQEEIGNAAAGDEVWVAAGTYEEGLKIDKSVSILGPNAAISPNNETREPEAILKPQGSVHAIEATAADIDVGIKGFTIDMSDSNPAGGDRFVHIINRANTSWDFEKNIFKNAFYSVNGNWYISGTIAPISLTIHDNYLFGSAASNGIALFSGDVTTINITNNTWENNGAWAMNFNNVHGVIANNTIMNSGVTDPTWPDDQAGIILASANNDVTMTGNTFENLSGPAVNIYDSFAGTLMATGNRFVNINFTAVNVREANGVTGDLTDVAFTGCNWFIDNNEDINNRSDDDAFVATDNWWGSFFGPDPTKIIGDVIYKPWSGDPACSFFLPADDDVLKAVDDEYTIVRFITVTAPGVLANDLLNSTGPYTARLITDLTEISGILNWSDAQDGSFDYIAPLFWTGMTTFEYIACDANNLCSAPATVTIQRATPPPDDNPIEGPLAVDDTYQTPINQELLVAAPGVLGNDIAPEGMELIAVLAQGNTNAVANNTGQLILRSDGGFTYTPPTDWTGVDSFTYMACAVSPGVCSDPATITITVFDDDPVTPTFIDVPFEYWAHDWIERLYRAGVTDGCATDPLQYCPENDVSRAEMAKFLLRGLYGANYTPPPVGNSTGFTDVPIDHWAAAWIKQLAAEGITTGITPTTYGPDQPVSRAEMAVFLLRAKYGPDYTPPPVGDSTGFTDVPIDHWAAAWIKQLAAEGITNGITPTTFGPDQPVTRAEMAKFLVITFDLP